jgi:hypothetical protein
MGSSTRDGFGFALAALMALILVAALAAIAGWLSIAMQPAPPGPFTGEPACRICGVVEEVRELDRASATAQPLNGDQSESIVILLAALGGGGGRLVALPRTFETAVRLEDGSLRVLRDAYTPQWKRGDRVKVIGGQVRPLVSSVLSRSAE